jgi:hypothetical protein
MCMLPFDTYPENGRQLLGQNPRSNCRHGEGPKLMNMTKQQRCAYCGVDLLGNYHQWLLMNVDHVVPKQLAELLKIPMEFWNDYANCVLACSGCNGLCNQAYKNLENVLPRAPGVQNDEQIFFDFRDLVFKDRFWLIAQARMVEMRCFDQKQWEQPEQRE